jgi:NitT/TauT family transport system permease protein
MRFGSTVSGPPAADALGAQMAGLDILEIASVPRRPRARRILAAAWPKVVALAIALVAWQAVVLSGWKPPWLLPSPVTVFGELWHEFATGALVPAIAVTLRRAIVGYALAVVVGGIIGLLVVRSKTLRAAVGSLITGLQTMPSIAWFPLAILLFQLSETAILFVVVLGAAPSIANGLISGVDHVSPILVRAGRVLGAEGLAKYRYVILPAALPASVAGLKQGWAFAWRSLMAGELLVLIPGQTSIGSRLQFSRDFSDAPGLIAMMLVILAIGIAVDVLVFSSVEQSIRARRGLVDVA